MQNNKTGFNQTNYTGLTTYLNKPTQGICGLRDASINTKILISTNGCQILTIADWNHQNQLSITPQ